MFVGINSYRAGWTGACSTILAGLAGRLLAIGCMLWTLSGIANAASLTANVDRDTTSVGESVTLSLVFGGSAPPTPPNVVVPPGLAVQSGGSSQQTIIDNGQVSSTLTYTYILTPQKIGEYVIPSVRVQVGGQILASQPLRLKVVAGEAAPGGGNGTLPAAFLQLHIPKRQIYLGEVLPVEIRLYCQTARNPQLSPLASDGFTLGKMAQPRQTQTQISNQVYNVVIYQQSVTPAKTGTLTLGPAECGLTVFIRSPVRRQRGWPFDLMDDPFNALGSMEARQVVLRSEPQSVQVLPLPTQNVPAAFGGAVGSYSLSVHAGPTNVAVGDPITVRVQISGRGALDALTLPAWDVGPAFKVYPPTSKLETSDALGLEGVKTFEYVIIPQDADLKQLPPVTFSFFAPEQRAYRTLDQPGLPLMVRPSAATSMPPGTLAGTSGGRPNAPATPDLINIKARLGAVVALRSPLLLRPWFLALQAAPILAWLSMYGWRNYTDKLRRNPRLRRQREVARLVDSGWQELRQHAEANEAEAFYATAFRLLQEQLGERLDLPASAITEAVLEDHLRPRGIAEETLALLHEVFQRCNQARYAPAYTSEGLYQFLPKVEAALQALNHIELG